MAMDFYKTTDVSNCRSGIAWKNILEIELLETLFIDTSVLLLRR
jgi:hypothetical protein